MTLGIGGRALDLEPIVGWITRFFQSVDFPARRFPQ
jgi:hypothetical protein